MIIILGPPFNVAYPFILDVEGYRGQIINLFVVLVSLFALIWHYVNFALRRVYSGWDGNILMRFDRLKSGGLSQCSSWQLLCSVCIKSTDSTVNVVLMRRFSARWPVLETFEWCRWYTTLALLSVRSFPIPLLSKWKNWPLYILNRYCLVGIGVMFFGVFYWAMWRVILPKIFKYELVPRKETLDDGTVVTLVRFLWWYLRVLSWANWYPVLL